jgi:alpha-mannosidase
MELRHAPLILRADYPGEAILSHGSHSFLSMEGPALLSAYYPAGDGVLLRFYEHTGKGGAVRFAFDRPLGSVRAVDLLDREVELPIRLEGKYVIVQVKPWQIITLRLEFQ